MTHLYELETCAPARFRATGLDAAHRIARRVRVAMAEALRNDPEVEAVEDEPYLRERAMRCEKRLGCRAALHYPACPARLVS